MKSFLVAFATNYVLEDSNFEMHEPTSILLLGNDAEQPSSLGSARTDVMIVVTINPENNVGKSEINAVSLPRDMLIENVCSGQYDKANAIYAYGYVENEETAIDCTKRSIEEFLNIPIDYYVSTSFSGLINLVDGIGGIEIDVPYDFCEQDAVGNACAISFEAGLQTLNGEEALAYARQRKQSSDYERNLRQQQVISAILTKVLSDPTEYLSTFVDVYFENMTTNITPDEVLSYANLLINFAENTLASLSTTSAFQLDIKSAPIANVTGVGTGSELVLGIDTTNLQTQLYSDLNDVSEASELSQQLASYTTVQRLLFSRKDTHIASSPYKFDEDGNIIEPQVSKGLEIQNYSLLVHDINGAYGFYSYASPFSLNYTSNMLRISLGLEPEIVTFNYTVIDDFGGPSLEYIFYEDELNYEVDFTSLYESYGINRISDGQYYQETNQIQEVIEPTDIVCGEGEFAVDTDLDGILDSCDVEEEQEVLVCEAGFELVDNECVEAVIPDPVCLEGQELVDGECVDVIECPAGQENVDGVCTEPEPEIPVCDENQEVVFSDDIGDYICVDIIEEA